MGSTRMACAVGVCTNDPNPHSSSVLVRVSPNEHSSERDRSSVVGKRRHDRDSDDGSGSQRGRRQRRRRHDGEEGRGSGSDSGGENANASSKLPNETMQYIVNDNVRETKQDTVKDTVLETSSKHSKCERQATECQWARDNAIQCESTKIEERTKHCES